MKSLRKLIQSGLLGVVLFVLSVATMLLTINSGALTVTNIAPGCLAAHSLFLKSDGSLWVMGRNDYGELGDGTYNHTNRSEQILASNVMAVAAGAAHSLFLKSDGSLWAMGYNYYGGLGDGTFIYTNRPEEIVASNVTAIAAGYIHSLFLKSDGSLWAMGDNEEGELGDGTYNNTNRPEEIVTDGVTAIAAGSEHSLFLKADGSLWAMGYNPAGQLGDGSNYFQGTNRPEEIVTNGVTTIAAGYLHSLFLKADGSLWAMGENSSGQLGAGTFNNTNRPEKIVASGVTAIAAGYAHSLFLKSDGSLWAMGNNQYGQLGDGKYNNNNNTNRPEQILASGVTAIAAGYYHSLFLKSDGSLWTMGNNFSGVVDSYGAIGDGFTNRFSAFPEMIFPSPRAVLSSALSSQTNLQFNATCGFGGNFYLLGSADMTLPFSQWTPLATNSVTARGTNNYSVTLTNAFNPGGRQFYILQSK